MSWSMTTLLTAWGAVATPADIVAVATAIIAGLAIVLAARLIADLPAASARGRLVPARVRAERARFIRATDPDAAGRPRPRAPGA
ncbi:hypothetical protein Drose_10475 [Dactylosporangium roseum]|uniref:Uncharacterized protein n=1 Tax=Dactylosporangium roseum TaxID=47989 RepID=A0ABY5Z954_9ACTN|nr:DUF6412 domain-containing protein [Dactylosporangium roseum]UWZ38616.1 hypothetical protein Drose_10475 [Dactylosporangium roseum]